MPSVNETLADSAVRHAVYLQRFGGTASREAIALLNEAERDIARRLEQRFARLGPLDRQRLGQGLATTKRLQAMLGDLRAQNRDLHLALGKRLRKGLRELASYEVDLASRRIDEAVGIDLGNLRPSPELLRAAVEGPVIRGQTLRQWFKKLEADTFASLDAAVKLGVIEGDTPQQLARRVRQALGVTKKKAEMLARTSVNAVGNQARELLYAENSDVIKAVRWLTTLDGRVSAVCASRSNNLYPVNEGPRPPAHPNCRSVMVPVTRSWSELAKPSALKPGRGARNIDRLFQKRLKEKGFRTEQARKIKRNTQASMTGQVPASLTYEQWLRRQSAEFQSEVLGPTKAKLFRQGKLSLDRFVEPRTGRPFTIAELRKKEASTFETLGIAA